MSAMYYEPNPADFPQSELLSTLEVGTLAAIISVKPLCLGQTFTSSGVLEGS